MRVSDERKDVVYRDGWDYAELEWQDLIPYDERFWPDHLDDDSEVEIYIQGYYDFWKSKNFTL